MGPWQHGGGNLHGRIIGTIATWRREPAWEDQLDHCNREGGTCTGGSMGREGGNKPVSEHKGWVDGEHHMYPLLHGSQVKQLVEVRTHLYRHGLGFRG